MLLSSLSFLVVVWEAKNSLIKDDKLAMAIRVYASLSIHGLAR